MPPRSLEHALEGIQFPCDRSRLVEYARRNQLGPHTLEALEAIPDRQYRDFGELVSALPEPRHAVDASLEQEDDVFVTPMESALQLWLCAVQAWPEWVRLTQRLWFPWLK
ncbi:MAG: DUF2795 domain-containing protein [Rhodospirillaceae bacterium]|nr:DUF2795 domain-containing protein [Rhodospirillales bacterium]